MIASCSKTASIVPSTRHCRRPVSVFMIQVQDALPGFALREKKADEQDRGEPRARGDGPRQTVVVARARAEQQRRGRQTELRLPPGSGCRR
jgi:hypothetical protein